MTRTKLSNALALTGAALFGLTAGLHHLGFSPVTALGAQGPADLRPLIPMLWLYFSLSLLVLAFIILAVAQATGTARNRVLALTALGPLAGAVLQFAYTGFIPPTALLLADAAVVLSAATLGACASETRTTSA